MVMKLSDAIREGSKLHAPSESGWTDFDEEGNIRTCALVAGAEGAGLIKQDGLYWDTKDTPLYPAPSIDERTGENAKANTFVLLFPGEWADVVNAIEIAPCPCKVLGVRAKVVEIIWHLHDIHRWSREAVAEWIETIENKLAARIAHNKEVSATLEKKTDCEAPELVKKP